MEAEPDSGSHHITPGRIPGPPDRRSRDTAVQRSLVRVGLEEHDWCGRDSKA